MISVLYLVRMTRNNNRGRQDVGAKQRVVFEVQYCTRDGAWRWWTTVMYRELAEKIVARLVRVDGRAARIVEKTEVV